MATPAAPAAPVTLTKVFVGNLSFKTREAELAQAFSGAGKVLNANIITRGPRSLGYGFVEFGSDAEAQKAVTLLNKKELDGREINVEVAKPREDGDQPEGPKSSGAPRRGGGAAGGAPGGGRRGGGQQGGAAGGAPGGGRRNQAAAGSGAPAPAGGQQGGAPRSGDYLPRRRAAGGFRGGRGGAAGGNGGGRQGGAGGQAGSQSPNANAAPRSSSATTLFVANLPFLVDDKGLEDLFKDFAPVSAHVVKKRNGKSKGFGFVELKGSEDQAKALAAMDKKEVQGRELIVKVALTEQVAKEQAAAAAPAPAPAPAAGSPAPAPAAAAPKASPQTDKKQ